jgi:hypothetical protein
VHPLHDSGTDRISKDDFTVDRALLDSGLSVTVNHDPRRKVGRIVDAATDDVGLWLVVDLDDEGEDVLARDGRVSIDVIQPKFRWLLSGVALLTPDSQAGIEGARAVFTSGGERRYFVEPTRPSDWPADQHRPWLSRVAREADTSGGTVVVDPDGVNAAAREEARRIRNAPATVNPDMAAARAEVYAASMSAVHDDVAYHRGQFERRQEQLREMRVEDVRTRLVAAMVPHSRWPEHMPERQAWDSMQAREDAERTEGERICREADNAAIRAVQASWRDREAATVVVDEPKVRMSWASRMLRAIRLR